MKLNEYQTGAMSTKLPTADITYAVLNIAGEAGEIASKYAKAVRDNTEVDRVEVAKELGDVLWCVTLAAQELGYSLEEIAQMNLDKLASRMKRAVLSGSGDNR
jgi:NTP pyrophosphatase (non-canonical NTP hydrolase)